MNFWYCYKLLTSVDESDKSRNFGRSFFFKLIFCFYTNSSLNKNAWYVFPLPFDSSRLWAITLIPETRRGGETPPFSIRLGLCVERSSTSSRVSHEYRWKRLSSVSRDARSRLVFLDRVTNSIRDTTERERERESVCGNENPHSNEKSITIFLFVFFLLWYRLINYTLMTIDPLPFYNYRHKQDRGFYRYKHLLQRFWKTNWLKIQIMKIF